MIKVNHQANSAARNPLSNLPYEPTRLCNAKYSQCKTTFFPFKMRRLIIVLFTHKTISSMIPQQIRLLNSILSIRTISFRKKSSQDSQIIQDLIRTQLTVEQKFKKLILQKIK